MIISSREAITSAFFALLISCGFFSHGMAQEAAITGSVFSDEEEPISFATIAVYDSTADNLLTGTQSDEAGNFYLELEPGTYLIRISSVSYEDFEEVVSLEAGETKEISEIILEQSPENLEDIDVQAERSQMQLEFDKRVFQVGSDVTTVGGSAIDVLDNVPSITTDIEGNVSLRGSEGVRILINGKPSSTYNNGSGALRGLSANMIEEIEVITNPSARYEAEGSAGIINIILKKNEDMGFNGNVAVGAGYPADYEISSNLNYRVDKINWFLNTSVDYRSDTRSSWSFQRYASADTSYMYHENSSSDDWEVDGNVRFGADYYLTASQTLTASLSMDLENGEDERVVNYTDLTLEEEVIQDVRRNDFTEEDESDFEFEVQYENLIDEDEHILTADFDVDISTEKEHSALNEIIEEGSGEPLLQRTTNRESEIDYRLRADYERPLSDKSNMEAGINSSYEFLENELVAEEQQNNEWLLLDTFNNNFTYHEIVNAAYGILSTRFGKFSTQIGLRLEQTIIDTKLKSSGEGSEQHYLQLFPSIFLNYEFNEQQSVQTSYSRRIRRPWSRMLLPFSSFSDSRTQSTGNPNLRPEFSNSYDVGFLQYWDTGSLLSSFYFRHTVDEFERITILDDEGITRRFPINLSTEKSWGLEFSVDQDILDVITLNGNANFFKSNSEGFYQGEDFSSETQTFYGRLGLQWDITDELRYQANMRYRGPRNTTQGRRGPRASVNSGLAYELFNGRGVASFNIRDVFNSRNSKRIVENPNFYSESENRWSTRSFMLTFTWYFNKENQ